MTNKTRKLTFTALFAAVATILMYFEFPLPFMPPFLKVDVSGAAILIGAFVFGLKPALAMILIKNFVHVFSSSTAGVGQLADFIMLSALVIVTLAIYNRHKTKKMALVAMGVGTVVMSIVGVFANMFLLIPFYRNIMPIEAIVSACNAINPAITGMEGYYIFGVLPFNLIKGAILSMVTMALYKKLATFIKIEHKKNLA